jgi:hypothetical protein
LATVYFAKLTQYPPAQLAQFPSLHLRLEAFMLAKDDFILGHQP